MLRLLPQSAVIERNFTIERKIEAMETSLFEKYQLQYLLLVKEFITEVEKGVEWTNLKPMIVEMNSISKVLESIDKPLAA